MQKTVQNSRQHHRRIETESGDAAAGKARKTDERVQNLDPNESRRAAGSGPARRSEVGRVAGPTAKRLLQTKRDIASLKKCSFTRDTAGPKPRGPRTKERRASRPRRQEVKRANTQP